MPKRKLPPKPKVWARIVGGRNWEVVLTNGEILRHSEDIDVETASRLAKSLPVFRIGYVMPVVDLSNDPSGLRDAIAQVGVLGFEHNTAHVFASREGTRAVIFNHHH